jgi:hypothetical protein
MRSSTSVGVLALLVGLSSAPRAFATACTQAAVREALLSGGDVDVVCATRTTIALDVALTVPPLPTTLEGHGKLVLAPTGAFPAFALPAAAVSIALRGVEISSGTALAATGGSTLELDRVYLHDIGGTVASGVRVDAAKLRLRGSTLVTNDATGRPLIALSASTLDAASSSLLGTGASAVRLAGGSKGAFESVTSNGGILAVAGDDRLTVRNSLIGGAISGPGGSLVSLGATLFAQTPPPGVHTVGALDQVGVPFQLRPLGSYDGGPVPTQPLAACSPGLNAGAIGAVGSGELDQNGSDRFQLGARDLGAVETAELPCLDLVPASGLLASVPEDLATGGEVTVSLSGKSTLPVSFFAQTADGFSAKAADGDYAPLAKTFTIPAGSTSFGIPVSGGTDPFFEDDESFELSISQPVNATITRSFGSVLVTNDDPAPVFAVADVCVEVVAGVPSEVDVAVVRTGATKKPVKVLYYTEDGTAKAGTDYTEAKGVISVLSTDPATQTVSVAVAPDSSVALPKVFVFHLQAPSNATLGKAAATITLAQSCADVGGNGGSAGASGGAAGSPAEAGGTGGAFGTSGAGGVVATGGNGGVGGQGNTAGASAAGAAGGGAGGAAAAAGSSGESGAAGGLDAGGEGGVGGGGGAVAGGAGEGGGPIAAGAGGKGVAGKGGGSGVAGNGVGGAAGRAGTAGGATAPGATPAAGDDDGCSLAAAGKPSRGAGFAGLLLALGLAMSRRRGGASGRA